MAFIDESQKGAANGVAALDAGTKVVADQRGEAPVAGGERDVRFKQAGNDVLGNPTPAIWDTNTPVPVARQYSFRTYKRTAGIVTLTYANGRPADFVLNAYVNVFGLENTSLNVASAQITAVTNTSLDYGQSGPDIPLITRVDQNNNPVDVGNTTEAAKTAQAAQRLNALCSAPSNVVQLGVGGYYLSSYVGIASDTVVKGAYGNGYAGAALAATADHSLIRTNKSLRGMLDNVSLSMAGADGGSKFAADLYGAGQWHVKDVFASSSNKKANFLRMTGCNNVLMDHVHCMENGGRYLEMLGLTNNVLFVGGSFEATSGKVGQGGLLDCYLNYDPATEAYLPTGTESPLPFKLLKQINCGFYGVQLERFGTLTIHSGGVTWQDGNISESSQIVLSHRSSECKIENTGGKIINLGSRNIVSRVHAANWSAERPIVIGENALTPVGTGVNEPAKSAYYPSDGSAEYLFWNRLSGLATGAQVRYWDGNHTGNYLDASPTGVNLVEGNSSLNNVSSQDDVTHVTCLKGTQQRLSAGAFCTSGTVELHTRAYRNLLADGTFDSGLSSKWSASSVTATPASNAFGTRSAIKLSATNAWEIAQIARLRPGRHYMTIACVKVGPNSSLSLSAGSANDGQNFARYVACGTTKVADLTQGGRSIGVDGGAGDDRQYLQIVWQMPVANNSGRGAFSKISLGGFGGSLNASDSNYVSWIALVDLDEPKKTLSFGMPPTDHGTWNVGDEVHELNPLVSGYMSWKSCVVYDDTRMVPAWGWVGIGEVYKRLPYTASLQVDTELDQRFRVTLAGNVNVAAPLHPVADQRLILYFQQDGTGGRTVSWNSIFTGLASFPNGSAATANQKAICIFKYVASSNTWALENAINWF